MFVRINQCKILSIASLLISTCVYVNKLGATEYTSVNQYGVECEIQRDQSKELQTALDNHRNWINRTLVFPENCNIAAVGLVWGGVNGSGGRQFTIKGNGTRLLVPRGTPVLEGKWGLKIQNAYNIRVESLVLDGNRDFRKYTIGYQIPAHNLYLVNVRKAVFNLLVSENAVVDGIYLELKTKDGKNDGQIAIDSFWSSVEDNDVYGKDLRKDFPIDIHFYDVVVRNASRNGVTVEQCWGCEFIGGVIAGTSAPNPLDEKWDFGPFWGMDFEDDSQTGRDYKVSVTPYKDITIKGVLFSDHQGGCIGLTNKTGPYTKPARFEIVENVFKNCMVNPLMCDRKKSHAISLKLDFAPDSKIIGNVLIGNKFWSQCRSVLDFGATDYKAIKNTLVEKNRLVASTDDYYAKKVVPFFYVHSENGGGHTFRENRIELTGRDISLAKIICEKAFPNDRLVVKGYLPTESINNVCNFHQQGP